MIKRIEVAAGLVFRQGKLLITQRLPDAHLANLWEFPGGKREPNESFQECLHRELMEELAIEVEVQELVQSIDHDYPGKSVHLEFFRAAWLKHEPQAIGCKAFAWVTAAQLNDYEFPEADAGLLETIKNAPTLWRE